MNDHTQALNELRYHRDERMRNLSSHKSLRQDHEASLRKVNADIAKADEDIASLNASIKFLEKVQSGEVAAI